MKLLRSVRMIGACAVLALLSSGCIFIARVDVTSSGGQVDAGVVNVAPAISANGRYVAFRSSADLGLGVEPTSGNIYVRDMTKTNNATMPVNVPISGNVANGASVEPAISGNGRYVAFASWASNLVAGDTNAANDDFVRDTQTGTTRRVDLDASGTQIHAGVSATRPSISDTGRYITFETQARLVSGDVDGVPSVYRKDMTTGDVALVSVGNGHSDGDFPSMSSDGNVIAFESVNALVPGDTGFLDIYVRNMSTGTIRRASVSSDGVQPNSDSKAAVISADGSRVVFYSVASNLVGPGDTNGVVDAFVHDLVGNPTTTRVDLSSAGAQTNGQLEITGQSGTRCLAGISGDGRYVTFAARATNLVPGDANGVSDSVFVRDTKTGTTRVVDTDQNGVQYADGFGACPAISVDGRYIGFFSSTKELVANDTNGYDTFLRANPVPTFASRTPASVARGTSVTITVTGTHFITGASGVNAYFGRNIMITFTNRVSETQVKFTISVGAGAATGARTIVVYNPGTGAGTLSGASTQFTLTID
jgi:hypothetical protein